MSKHIETARSRPALWALAGAAMLAGRSSWRWR